jgi:hypothetical protein
MPQALFLRCVFDVSSHNKDNCWAVTIWSRTIIVATKIALHALQMSWTVADFFKYMSYCIKIHQMWNNNKLHIFGFFCYLYEVGSTFATCCIRISWYLSCLQALQATKQEDHTLHRHRVRCMDLTSPFHLISHHHLPLCTMVMLVVFFIPVWHSYSTVILLSNQVVYCNCCCSDSDEVFMKSFDNNLAVMKHLILLVTFYWALMMMTF